MIHGELQRAHRRIDDAREALDGITAGDARSADPGVVPRRSADSDVAVESAQRRPLPCG